MSDALITTLKTLKLFGMAESVANLAEQASPVYQQAVPILETLLKAEVAEREARSIAVFDGDTHSLLGHIPASYRAHGYAFDPDADVRQS